MNEVANPVAAVPVAVVGAPVMRNEVLITIGGNDEHIPLEALGLTMQSTEREIVAAVRPLMRERHGIDIADQDDVRGEGAYADVTYVTRKALNENVIHVYPKPTAGASLKKRINIGRRLLIQKESCGNKLNVKYAAPSWPNDRKRVGRELVLSTKKGSMRLNGVGIRQLVCVLRQAGEIE